MNPVATVMIQSGTSANQQLFAPDCKSGDWKDFPITFPTPFPPGSDANIRVIVSAQDQAAIVPVVKEVKADHFVVSCRNSGCAAGRARINWMALLEGAAQRVRVPPSDIRMGTIQPLHYAPDCSFGDTWFMTVPFGTAFPGPASPTVLLTAADLPTESHAASVVGVVESTHLTHFEMHGRNSDCAEGDGAFYFVGHVNEAASTLNANLMIDSGIASTPASGSAFFQFSPDCKSGDRQQALVYFNGAFQSPPVVLLTAIGPGPAVVGMAQTVTTNGFTISMRNSDCHGGRLEGGFFWVAFGCGTSCA